MAKSLFYYNALVFPSTENSTSPSVIKAPSQYIYRFLRTIRIKKKKTRIIVFITLATKRTRPLK